MRLTPGPAWLLVLLLAAFPLAAQAPPESLFFGLAGLQQRTSLDPPLVTLSGQRRIELVELDRLAGPEGPQLRLILRCRATSGKLPAELGLVGDVYAVDNTGRELTAQAYQGLSVGDVAWLAVTLSAPAGTRLSAFGATIGPPPQEEERLERLPLNPGEASCLNTEGLAVGLALVRRETALLPLADEPPPLYRGLESTLGATDTPPAADEAHPYLTLRLYTLGRPETPDGWRLVNLRLPGTPPVADWRYARYLWRPDWGGWLGAKGRDWEAVTGQTGPSRGVLIEQVVGGGPGQAAGLRTGDLLVALDGQPVPDAFTLGERIRAARPGATVRCEVRRGSTVLVLPVALAGRSLWPEHDETEFRDAWDRLVPLLPRTETPVLSLWDWQTRVPLAAGDDPREVELVFRQTVPTGGTTFLFRHVPLG